MTDVLCRAQQLAIEHVGLVLGDECVYFFGCLTVVEIAALHGQALEEGADEPQKYLSLVDFDEAYRLTIGLQGMKGVLLADLWVVVERAKDDFVVLCKLFYLVESPQLVAFFERIGDAGQEDKNLHLNGFRGQR